MTQPARFSDLDELHRRVADFMAPYRPVFARADQYRWAILYVVGLLTEGRKSVEPLAQRVCHLVVPPVSDAAQALQNFVNQSPWDERVLWRAYRRQVASRLGHTGGVVVVHESTFEKSGRQSIGVQRQFSQALGRKANCQILVSLDYVSPAGAAPVGRRLYLPAGWLRDPHRLDAAGVPADARRPSRREELAVELLDEILGEGLPARAVVFAGRHTAGEDLAADVRRRGLAFLIEPRDDVRLEAPSGPSETVSGRQRVWPLPGQPYSSLAGPDGLLLFHTSNPDGESRVVLSDLDARTSPEEAQRLWFSQRRVDVTAQVLRGELGLDHFEGRSWRGLHHHVCLVMLAHEFRMSQPPDEAASR